jgi:RNA polymerase sigma factor (sigma-70 family)
MRSAFGSAGPRWQGAWQPANNSQARLRTDRPLLAALEWDPHPEAGFAAGLSSEGAEGAGDVRGPSPDDTTAAARVGSRRGRAARLWRVAKPQPVDQRARAALFERLVLPHLDDAYNLARWLTRNGEDAEDLVQEAYLRGLRFFVAESCANPRAWILTIVRNTFYTWHAARRAHPEVQLGEASDDPDGDRELELWDPNQETPETALMRKSEDLAISRLMEALPANFRETLVLREMEDFSYQQIAEITGVPVGTVMSRLSRARALLAAAWKKLEAKERTP